MAWVRDVEKSAQGRTMWAIGRGGVSCCKYCRLKIIAFDDGHTSVFLFIGTIGPKICRQGSKRNVNMKSSVKNVYG